MQTHLTDIRLMATLHNDPLNENQSATGTPTPGTGGIRGIPVIINGTQHIATKGEMTFREIIDLAGLVSGPNVSYTLTYRKGAPPKAEGSLVEGDTVTIQAGMIFNATATDKS